MERLTKRIASHVYYTQGKYEETIPAEMETNDIRNVLKKLAEYEDAEEQGLLLRLPIKKDDKFWEINRGTNPPSCYDRYAHSLGHCVYVLERLGKICFLTRSEAEQALERMVKEND